MTTPAKKKRRTAAQLASEGFAALVEKLGLADALRYVQLYYDGEGDYTSERQAWLDRLPAEEVNRLMRNSQGKLRKQKRHKGKV